MSTVKSFVKQFVAAVQGDSAAVQAEKTFRQATSALKSQISSLEGDTVNLEDAVEDAKEAQTKARINNGEPITNKGYYISALISAQNRVLDAEANLKNHTEKIAFLKSELALLDSDVEA